MIPDLARGVTRLRRWKERVDSWKAETADAFLEDERVDIKVLTTN